MGSQDTCTAAADTLSAEAPAGAICGSGTEEQSWDTVWAQGRAGGAGGAAGGALGVAMSVALHSWWNASKAFFSKLVIPCLLDHIFGDWLH